MKGKSAKEWLTDATWKLVEERRNLKPKRRENAESRGHYDFLYKEIKRQSQLDKDSYLRSLCEQVEKAHMQEKSKEIIHPSIHVYFSETSNKIYII